MKKLAALLAAIAVGTGVSVKMTSAQPPARTESPKEAAKPENVGQEDPLSAGSVVRLGTTRFRNGIPVSDLVISADGKMAVAVNGNHMLGATRVFDMVSGRVLYTLGGWEGTDIEAAAISPDGRTIVTKQDFSLRIRDAANGNEIPGRKIALPRVNQYSRNEWVEFTPDGKAIAVTSQGNVIHLIDFETGKTIREFSNNNPESNLSSGFDTVLGIAISPDGKLMASGGFCNDKDNYFARLWDIETGKEIRRFMHGRSYGIPTLAFSGDGKLLVTGAHDSRLRLFDVESGKLLRVLSNGERRMVGGCVAISPDGKMMASAGKSLRVYDASTGEEKWHLDRTALGLQFTDGGKTLTGAVMGAIHRWDAATGKPLTPDGGDSPVEQIILSDDGKRIVTHGSDGDAHIWDGITGQHLRQLSAAGRRGLAMSPDGKFLAWGVGDSRVKYPDINDPRSIHEGSRIRLFDVAADKPVDRFPGFKGDGEELSFINDGKQIISADHGDGMVRIWNVEAGKEERSFQAVREEEKKMSNCVWRTALSPDGKTLAVAYVLHEGGRSERLGLDSGETYPIRVWDIATGKELHQFENGSRYVNNMAFSPDGRWLVSSGSAFDKSSGTGAKLLVWDVFSGTTAATLPTGACAVSFSGDGRYLSSADSEGLIQLWETATWTLRSEYKGHRDRPTALAFSPNRPLLYSGSYDTTVLGWDLRIPPAAAGGSLEKAWEDLELKDARQALKPEGQFLAAPADAVKLLDEKIKPAQPMEEKRIEQCIGELDSDRYATREAAAKELIEAGQHIVPHLEKALTTTSSEEVRQTIGKILRQVQVGTPAPLRATRAVSILEQLADADSKKLLTKWAAGQAGAPLTVQAASALKRMESACDTKR